MKKYLLFILLFVLLLTFSCKKEDILSQELKITLNPGIDTVEVYTSFEDAGAVAYKGLDLVAVSKNSNVNITEVGTYQIVYTATYNDQSVSVTRKVTVTDQTPPEVRLLAGVDTIKVGETWVDAGVYAQDNSLKDVTVEVTGKVDNTKVGEYLITYIVKDLYGNETSIVRYVNVV